MILLGHNGAGKTTLINYLLGFYTSTDQHPFLAHFEEVATSYKMKSGEVTYAPESTFFDPEMSAKDYFRLLGAIRNDDAFDPESLLRQVALEVSLGTPIRKYSKGMKQRLMLALALIGKPGTLILDEPTGGLDHFSEKVVRELIIRLAASHRLILSTHSLALAAALDDEVWVLQQGRIVHTGPVLDEPALRNLLDRYPPEVLA